MKEERRDYQFKKDLIEAWSKADIIVSDFAKEKSESKFGNKRLRVNDVLYDSHKEYYRHLELSLLQKYGKISNLKFHDKNDVLLIISNPDVKYIPDFTYVDSDGQKVVEDVKGMQTPDFIIKKKIVVSKIRAKEYDFKFILTRKYKNGFQAFEEYSQNQTYIKPKLKRKKKKRDD